MDPHERITRPGDPPTDTEVRAWLGEDAHAFWKRLVQRIATDYANIFSPEWLYGGKKHGWSLRYKKSSSFCTLVPEQGRFMLLVVLGGKERDSFEASRHLFSTRLCTLYDETKTYHDGKWLFLEVNSEAC